jgi:RNA polymerase sigma-70 factor (ECF subfamily)
MGTIEPTDGELFERVRAGDRAALELLLERHEPAVLRFGMQMCGDVEDARDVLQETLLAAARTAPEFRGDASVSSWLYAIARSFCIKKRRRRKDAPARVESLDALADGEAAVIPDAGRGPDEALHDRRVGEALREAIAALDPGQREVLVLRDVEGLTAPEVAEVTGLKVEAVKSRLHRARLAVRERIAPLLGLGPEPAAVATEPRAPGAGCPDVLSLLSQHLEGDIGPSVCAQMEAHVAACPRCRHACDSLKRAVAICRSTPSPTVPTELRASIRRAVRELRATAVPDAVSPRLRRSD